MKNTQSKIKPIKTGKQPGATYCLGCKDFAHNFRPRSKNHKSNCVICWPNKSTFLKQKHIK